jgi:hypothetical protein
LNPAVLPPDQLPPNHLNNRKAPSVIIRQKGADVMQLIFIKEQKVYNVAKSRFILDYFNPDTTEYWYEPEQHNLLRGCGMSNTVYLLS